MDIRNKIIDYLLSFFVMEEPRKACYLCDDLRNIFQEEFLGKCTFLYSGSFVEGMINHGDIDIMNIATDFLVVEHPDSIPETFTDALLLLESDHCEPGYTRLQLYRDIPRNQFDIYTNQGGKLYLNRRKYLKIKFGKREMLEIDMHGPALLTFNHSGTGDSDMVECFHCPVWPIFARREFSTFQGNNEIVRAEKVRNVGCHVVPIAHPKSNNPDLEFRLSFSAAEKYLIQHWNIKQMYVYFLCKELFKKFFSTGLDLEKGLCSYFAKTIIYWMNEQCSTEFWTNTSTITILERFLDLLKIYISNKSCPNYFIPNNLMMSTYTDEQVNSLLSKLNNIRKDIFYAIICCDIFSFADNKLLASLYRVISVLGYQSNVDEILSSIYLSDFANGCNKRYLVLGGIKRVYHYRFMHYYFLDFMRFCLGKFLVGVALHSSQEFSNVRKRLNELSHDSYIFQCANMYINRCLAIISLSAIFHVKEEEFERKKKLLKDTEKLFILSLDVPGEFSDGAVNGGIYLGLFYYLTDQKDKSQQILADTARSALERYRFWKTVSHPILLMNEKTRLLKCPSFLLNENILRDLFEKWHLHGGVRLDPLFLCSYLLHRITNDELDLVNFVKAENETCDSEVSNYVRYRLGFFKEGSDEFTKYSKNKNCLLCRLEHLQQSG